MIVNIHIHDDDDDEFDGRIEKGQWKNLAFQLIKQNNKSTNKQMTRE